MNRPVLPVLPAGLNALTAHWGWLAVRGIAAIIFGILAFVWPGFTITTLALVWGAYAIVGGAFALVYGVRGGGKRRMTYALVGLIGVLAGLIALFWPGETAIILAMIIGAWALASGVMELLYAFQYRRANAHPWVVGLSGLLSALVGLFILIFPGAGALSLIWLIGAYAIFYGVLMIFAAIQLRRFHHRMS